MENTPPFLSNLDSDFSSGYLQDALFKFSSKRRRLLLFDDNENYQTKDSNNSIKVYWRITLSESLIFTWKHCSSMFSYLCAEFVEFQHGPTIF